MQSLTDVPSKDSGSVTRSDLADAVRRRVGLSRAESADHVEAVLAETEVIVSGESLKLHSFGSFHVRSKNERAARNPKTGNPATVSARRVVTFKPSGIFRVASTNVRKRARRSITRRAAFTSPLRARSSSPRIKARSFLAGPHWVIQLQC